jgi:hypothetical protein
MDSELSLEQGSRENFEERKWASSLVGFEERTRYAAVLPRPRTVLTGIGLGVGP